jgi:hypothetical protein
MTKMSDYIEREAVKKLINIDYGGYHDAIDRIPAADVAPVVQAHWAHLGGDEWCCSACGFVITTEGSWDKPTKKYCEDCGARMDEVK